MVKVVLSRPNPVSSEPFGTNLLPFKGSVSTVLKDYFCLLSLTLVLVYRHGVVVFPTTVSVNLNGVFQDLVNQLCTPIRVYGLHEFSLEPLPLTSFSRTSHCDTSVVSSCPRSLEKDKTR